MKLIPQRIYASKLFDNNVVDDGNAGNNSKVARAIFNTINELVDNAIYIPKGPELASIDTINPAAITPEIVENIFSSQQATSTSIVLFGESHVDKRDRQRAENYLAAMNTTPPTLTPTLVVFERGLTYSAPDDIPLVHESNLTTINSNGNMFDFDLQLSKAQRSMVVAGYLALCVGLGNQQDINCIIL